MKEFLEKITENMELKMKIGERDQKPDSQTGDYVKAAEYSVVLNEDEISDRQESEIPGSEE